MNTCLIGKNLLLEKEDFCSHVKIEDITIQDYKNAKEVSKDFDFGVYHELYVQSDALLIADVFDNFQCTCLEIYWLDPAHFLLAPGLAQREALKRPSKIRSIN